MSTVPCSTIQTDTFTEDQSFLFEQYREGANLFITGPGGCGKSYLIQNIVKDAEHAGKQVCVTAMTGCAAVLLECGATTLHSWAGIGLAKADDNVIITRIQTNKYKRKNWKRTDLLIIDEISMMSKRMFGLLDAIAKAVRKDARPFGGMQIICSGDFYQLPPVHKGTNTDEMSFCFESPHWNNVFDYQVLLDKSFRQKDETYVAVLNEIREGRLSKQGYNLLRKRVGKSPPEDSPVKPVILYPTKNHVNILNQTRLTELEGEGIVFASQAVFQPTEEQRKRTSFKKPTKTAFDAEITTLKKNSLFEDTLTLKVGCQVMCIANIDLESDICNGTTGVVIGFHNRQPRVKFANGREYVFETRAWESDNYPGVCVKQLPLILAWAVTIHKAQGATLQMADIDIGSSVFAPGQSYVALSRVKDLEGLYLRSFQPQKIKVNEKVRDFYQQFYEEDDGDHDNESEDGEEPESSVSD